MSIKLKTIEKLHKINSKTLWDKCLQEEIEECKNLGKSEVSTENVKKRVIEKSRRIINWKERNI